ncbi:MAG: hypothetical protein PHH85_12215 [Candidatus Methanoperedens sp.]|nr:hypothetical protein [Candidatus Methanoperedens sp.]
MKVNKTQTRTRAEELVNLGFGVADAAQLIKKCLNHKINVWCGNPVAFCEMEDLK